MDATTKILNRSRAESLSAETEFARVSPIHPEGFGARVVNDDASAGRAPLDITRPSVTFMKSQRVVAFDNSHWMTRYYDMLRNLLHGTTEEQIHTIAVTSPTAGCGATVSAMNLALSFARIPGARVLLVDANMRDPAMGRLLGLPSPLAKVSDNGTAVGVLTTLEFGSTQLHFMLPSWGNGSIPAVAALQRFKTQIEHAGQYLKPSVIILDVAPVLETDETIPLVLEAASVAMVLATGESKRSDMEVCQTLLGSRKNVHFVLNKSGKHGL
jgi:protein-tyrosine kinase